MSGIVGSCIVCGTFHATGHFGDNYVLLTLHSIPVLACPECVPFAPKPGEDKCKLCGAFTVRYIYPEKTYGHDHDYGFTCNGCKEAQRHAEMHERLELMSIGNE